MTGLGPKYISEVLVQYEASRPLGSSERGLLLFPESQTRKGLISDRKKTETRTHSEIINRTNHRRIYIYIFFLKSKFQSSSLIFIYILSMSLNPRCWQLKYITTFLLSIWSFKSYLRTADKSKGPQHLYVFQ